MIAASGNDPELHYSNYDCWISDEGAPGMCSVAGCQAGRGGRKAGEGERQEKGQVGRKGGRKKAGKRASWRAGMVGRQGRR